MTTGWRRALGAAAAGTLLLSGCAGTGDVTVHGEVFYGGSWYYDPWYGGGDVDIDIDRPERPEHLPWPPPRPDATPRPTPLPSTRPSTPATRPSMPASRPMPAARGGRR